MGLGFRVQGSYSYCAWGNSCTFLHNFYPGNYDRLGSFVVQGFLHPAQDLKNFLAWLRLAEGISDPKCHNLYTFQT